MINEKPPIFDENNVPDFKTSFSLFDKDGDQTIETMNLPNVVKSLGLVMTEPEINEIKDALAPDNANEIEIIEFIKFFSEKLKYSDSEDELLEIFKEFDKEGTGKITSIDLRYALNSLGEKIADDETDDLLKEASADPDGNINFVDFVNNFFVKK